MRIAIEDRRILEGSLPPKAARPVGDWRRAHVAELGENWLRVQRPEPPSTIEWPNGLDAAPEVLHGDFERMFCRNRTAHSAGYEMPNPPRC